MIKYLYVISGSVDLPGTYITHICYTDTVITLGDYIMVRCGQYYLLNPIGLSSVDKQTDTCC